MTAQQRDARTRQPDQPYAYFGRARLSVTARSAEALGLEADGQYALIVADGCLRLRLVQGGNAAAQDGLTARLRRGYRGSLRLSSQAMLRALDFSSDTQCSCRAYRDGDSVVVNTRERLEYRRPGDSLAP